MTSVSPLGISPLGRSPFRHFALSFLAVGTVFFSAAPAEALFACETKPGLLRYDDRETCPNRLFENPSIDVTLGGEIRQRYEYTHNPSFGDDPQDDAGVWLQRFTAHADVVVGDQLRVFTQLLSANELGREGGPSPVDEDRFAVQNLFAELRDPSGTVSLRVGRQELRYGRGRLINMREGPNVRRTFDAARLFLDTRWAKADVLVSRPVRPLPGSFDNTPSDTEMLFGVHATTKPEMLPLGRADFYVFHFEDEAARYAQGRGEEERTSVGLRLFGGLNGWDWNWEAVYQFGDFSGGDIRAWMLAADTGYSFQDVPWTPRVGFNATFSSGDEDPNDGTLETFNPMYPLGSYFTEVAFLSARNVSSLRPSIGLSPLSKLSLDADVNFLWRTEEADALYGPPGQLSRSGGAGHFIGTAFSLAAEYEVTDRFTLEAVAAHFIPDQVIETTGPDDAISLIELTAAFKF